MNKLPNEKRAAILTALIVLGREVANLRVVEHKAGFAFAEKTENCHLRGASHATGRCDGVALVQCDEVWSFCYAKQKNVPARLQGQPGFGSVWTWTALDSDSKLMISWLVSDRSQQAANAIIRDLKSRITKRIQISSDGLPQYLEAVVKTFRPGEVDHAEVIKVFANSKPGTDVSPNSAASRYSPGRMLSVEKRIAFGEPDADRASTSHMERWNLTLRMQNRRFTRLTNGFSKKLENHSYMLAITMVYYNFCRKHKSLGGQTPAMAAGLTSYRWTASGMLSLDMWANEASAA